MVAFAFGLLHGFGFASGLKATGLPQADIAWALLLFNVGVEIGQVFFVFLILAMARSFRTLEIRWPRWALALPGYTVGTLGAYLDNSTNRHSPGSHPMKPCTRT